jgi:hypothetical protein
LAINLAQLHGWAFSFLQPFVPLATISRQLFVQIIENLSTSIQLARPPIQKQSDKPDGDFAQQGVLFDVLLGRRQFIKGKDRRAHV